MANVNIKFNNKDYLLSCDDGQEDNLKELSEHFPKTLHFIRRSTKKGLGTAYIEGFSQALASKADYIFQMDADLSHSPEYIPAFLNILHHADVVIGSRYVSKGGYDSNWSYKRRFLSRLANNKRISRYYSISYIIIRYRISL